MGCQFHALTAYAKYASLDEHAVRHQLFSMVRSSAGDVVFVAEREDHTLVGMLGASITSPWFNPSYRVMLELFWWVDTQARESRTGPALLQALEQWWPQYANGLLMLATPNIEPEKMARLYRMKGFVRFDSYFSKFKD
jgi:hypothetical protein